MSKIIERRQSNISLVLNCYQNPENEDHILSPNLLYPQNNVFMKSQISLAETTCQEYSPSFTKCSETSIEERSVSLGQFNLEDEQDHEEIFERCSDYFQNGFCMLGCDCDKSHKMQGKQAEQKANHLMKTSVIMNQFPELIVAQKNRLRSFLF